MVYILDRKTLARFKKERNVMCIRLPHLREHRRTRSISSLSLLCSAHSYLISAPPPPQWFWNCTCQRSPVTTNWQISGLVSNFRTNTLLTFNITNHILPSSFCFCDASPLFLLTSWLPLFSLLLSFCPSMSLLMVGSVPAPLLSLYTHYLVI